MSKQHRRLGQGVCLRLVTLLLVVAQVLVQVWNLSRRSETPPRRHTHEISTEQPKTTKAASHFSPEWVMQYAVGDEGCHLARGSYNWRGHGLGNNINGKSSTTTKTAYHCMYIGKRGSAGLGSTKWAI